MPCTQHFLYWGETSSYNQPDSGHTLQVQTRRSHNLKHYSYFLFGFLIHRIAIYLHCIAKNLKKRFREIFFVSANAIEGPIFCNCCYTQQKSIIGHFPNPFVLLLLEGWLVSKKFNFHAPIGALV